jgi:hypothetical protein
MLLLISVAWVNGQSSGFELVGYVQHGGFIAGRPIWNVGYPGAETKAMFGMVVGDPSLNNRLKDMEGKQIRITLYQEETR